MKVHDFVVRLTFRLARHFNATAINWGGEAERRGEVLDFVL